MTSTSSSTSALHAAIHPSWLTSQGTLDPCWLLDAFLAFWCRHGQPLLASAPYHELALTSS